MTGQVTLFIYYKVQEPQSADVRAALRQLEAELPASHRLRVMRRTEATHGGLETWMEIHGPFERSTVPGQLELIAGLAGRLGLETLSAGGRVVEQFEDMEGLSRCV